MFFIQSLSTINYSWRGHSLSKTSADICFSMKLHAFSDGCHEFSNIDLKIQNFLGKSNFLFGNASLLIFQEISTNRNICETRHTSQCTYTISSRYFNNWWPEGRSSVWISTKAPTWWKNKIILFMHRIGPILSASGHLSSFLMTQVQFVVSDLLEGHSRSSEVKNTFLTTFKMDEGRGSQPVSLYSFCHNASSDM